jgi:RNase H-fold protein (predicted Holliday junction resolvase)
MCGVARSFVRRLQKRCQVTVYYVDESFSSDEARETMGTKGPLDSSAACLILDRYFKSGPLSTTS